MRFSASTRLRRATKPSSPAQHHIKDSLLRQVLLAFRTHLGTHSADGPIVTGTPCPALADPGPAWLALSGKQTPRSTEAFLRFADRGHGSGIPPDAGVNKLRLVVTDVPDAASRHLCQRRCLERLAASSARCWRLPRAGGNRRDSRLGGEKSAVRSLECVTMAEIVLRVRLTGGDHMDVT